MSKEVERYTFVCDIENDEYVLASDYDAILAERDRLRDTLEQAAQSLESINKLAGRDEFMQDVLDIRGCVNVARAALQGDQP